MLDHKTKDISIEISALKAMPMSELKRVWMQYFAHDPSVIQREYMMRRIAYEMQAAAYGRLLKSIHKKLQKFANEVDQQKQSACLSAGTELVRDYQGKSIRVRVLVSGFEYNNVHYKSLSAIATEVMGCRVSGPKFFGLREA